MAEIEVDVVSPPAAAETNGVSNGQPFELPSYEEDLLIKVKGKVKRPTRPDDSERNIIQGKLQAEVVKNSDRIKEIKEILDNRQRTGRVVPPEQAELRKRLDASKQEFQSVLRQKQHIREELTTTIATQKALKDEIRSLREKTPRGVNLADLEPRLAELEFKMTHESVSEVEEKRMNQQMANMNAAKPVARQHAIAEAKLKEVDEARNLVSKRLTECDLVLNSIRAREDVDKAVLEKLQAESKEGETTVDFPALTVEKQECWQVITALRDKMTEIRKDFDDKYKEYIKLDKNYNAWLRHDKRRQWEDRQKARADRESEENANEQAATGEHVSAEPFTSEILTLEQLMTYLRKFGGAGEAVKVEEEKVVEIPQGMKPMKKKDDSNFDFMVVKKAVKGGKGGKVGAAPVVATSSKAPADPSKKKLSHTLELLQTFMMFGIDVPQTVGELPATLEKAEAKKADFLEQRKIKKEAPARRAAAAAPAGSNGKHEEVKEETTPAPETAAAEEEEASAAEEDAEETPVAEEETEEAPAAAEAEEAPAEEEEAEEAPAAAEAEEEDAPTAAEEEEEAPASAAEAEEAVEEEAPAAAPANEEKDEAPVSAAAAEEEAEEEDEEAPAAPTSTPVEEETEEEEAPAAAPAAVEKKEGVDVAIKVCSESGGVTVGITHSD